MDDDYTHTTCYPALLDRQEGDPEAGEAEDAQQEHHKKKAADHLDKKDVKDSDAIKDFLPFTFIRTQRVIRRALEQDRFLGLGRPLALSTGMRATTRPRIVPGH